MTGCLFGGGFGFGFLVGDEDGRDVTVVIPVIWDQKRVKMNKARKTKAGFR